MSLQRDLEHTRPGSRLVAGRNFLYSCSISLDVLFSFCISVDGCLPVDLLHCSLLLLHNFTSCCCLILTSSTYPTPPKHCPDQFIWLDALVCHVVCPIIQVDLLHQKRIPEILFQPYLYTCYSSIACLLTLSGRCTTCLPL